MQGVSLTAARERGQLVVLEGLKSAVDVFFRPREERHPLQVLRSVSLQVGPAPGLRVTPFSLPDEWEGRAGCRRQALPGCLSITQGPRLCQRLCACPGSCRKLRSPRRWEILHAATKNQHSQINK